MEMQLARNAAIVGGLVTERRARLAELADQFGVSVSTVGRWCRRGIRGVRLETLKVGGTTFVTREAVERFIERLNAASPPPTVAAGRGDTGVAGG